jgi:hypothetical protein
MARRVRHPRRAAILKGFDVIVDAFMFDDEFDMLDCRLYQLQGIVDLFVAIEGNRSVSGIPKPYHLTDNLSRYPDVAIQIIQVPLDHVEGDWNRDKYQRAGATDFLATLPRDTVLITGDLDEIPRRETVMGFPGFPISLIMPHLVYSAHWQHPQGWVGPGIAKLGDIPDATEVRYNGDRRHWPEVLDSGWHLSWFGTPETRQRKMRHFAHQELVPTIGDRVGDEFPRQHMHVDGKTTLIPYEGDWPHWIADGLAPDYWMETWREEA